MRVSHLDGSAQQAIASFSGDELWVSGLEKQTRNNDSLLAGWPGDSVAMTSSLFAAQCVAIFGWVVV